MRADFTGSRKTKKKGKFAMNKVNLETFAGGALQEKFDAAMEQVLKNMMEYNKKRSN